MSVPTTDEPTDPDLDTPATTDEPIVDELTTSPAVDASASGPTGRFASVPDPVRALLRWVLVLGGAFALYAVFLVMKGADPIDVLVAMWDSAFGDAASLGETLMRATPLALGALAVAVPARAGLFNIGGEGQLILGGIGAAGAAYAVGDQLPTAVTLAVMALGGALAGAAWAGIPIVLRLVFETSEAIVSLLSNYLATIVLAWIVFEPWRDPKSTGQAYSTALAGPQRLPIIWGNRVNAGILVAAVVVPLVYLAFTRTRWGFRLRVLGGNPEAARRAGFAVRRQRLNAFLIGGALAGLGGFVAVAGVEGRLRPDLLVGFGYTAFLASWLGRHQPFKVALAAIALAAIAVGGTGLKITAGLSGGAVNILMALLLLAVLGWGRREATT